MALISAFPGCCAGQLLTGFYTYGANEGKVAITKLVESQKNIPFMQAVLTTAQKKIFGDILETNDFKEVATSRGAHGEYKCHIYIRLSNRDGTVTADKKEKK